MFQLKAFLLFFLLNSHAQGQNKEEILNVLFEGSTDEGVSEIGFYGRYGSFIDGNGQLAKINSNGNITLPEISSESVPDALKGTEGEIASLNDNKILFSYDENGFYITFGSIAEFENRGQKFDMITSRVISLKDFTISPQKTLIKLTGEWDTITSKKNVEIWIQRNSSGRITNTNYVN